MIITITETVLVAQVAGMNLLQNAYRTTFAVDQHVVTLYTDLSEALGINLPELKQHAIVLPMPEAHGIVVLRAQVLAPPATTFFSFDVEDIQRAFRRINKRNSQNTIALANCAPSVRYV